jgi:hypothetical protein
VYKISVRKETSDSTSGTLSKILARENSEQFRKKRTIQQAMS